MLIQLRAPRSAEPESPDDLVADPEALMKEARRRARRRRAAYALATSAALGAALALIFGHGGGGESSAGRHSNGGPPRDGLPEAGRVDGTFAVDPRSSVLFAARGDSLFVVEVGPAPDRSMTVLRMHAARVVQRRQLTLPLAGYLADVSVGTGGIYAGTSVVRRFTTAPDQLVRIDANTLEPHARASFPAGIATTEHGRLMWGSVGDGRVVRLDPRTLAVRAAHRVLPRAAAIGGSAGISKPAFGLGSLWVLAGNAPRLELIRLDPVTLAVRSTTRVPTGGILAQTLNHVAADSHRVFLVGEALVRVAASGELVRRPVLVPGLANAALGRDGLVGLTADTPALVLVDGHGGIRARTPLTDASGQIVASSRNVWFLGAASRTGGIVHAQLLGR